MPLPADDVRVYFAGADKFGDLLAEMRRRSDGTST